MPTYHDSNFHRLARLSGLFYLGIILLGLTAELGLRGAIIDTGDVEATRRAMVDTGYVRLSVLFDLGMVALDVGLAVALFTLLRAVNMRAALFAMVLRLMQASVILAGLVVLVAADTAARGGADPLPLIGLHGEIYDMGLIFFGVNGLVMARLLCAAGAPRILAAGLIAAGLVYIAGGITRLVAPDLNTAMQPAYLVPLIVEIALMAWLLAGGRPRRQALPA